MSKHRILVVDDEESLCEILKFNLEIEGFVVDTVNSAEEALRTSIADYSLILLDVMMGQMSGFRMAQIVREDEKTAHVPIIFCTAKGGEDDTIAGFTIGADDYITKPFSVREVVARVKSVLKRSKPMQSKGSEERLIEYGTLVIDLNKKSCTLDGELIQLTRKELDILTLFLQNKNIIFTRQDILMKVWSDEVIVLDRTIDVNITRLRKKIKQYGEHIVTRQGYGYGFED